jgi:hypothetical protein
MSKLQVKIFSARYGSELEEILNNVLSKFTGLRIVDIKYATNTTFDRIKEHNAMIIYEVED